MHVSQLAHKFVSDAREVVKTGDIVKVQVVEVDVVRKRIGLTMKLGEAPRRADDRGPARSNRYEGADRSQRVPHRAAEAQATSAMASAFSKLHGLRK